MHLRNSWPSTLTAILNHTIKANEMQTLDKVTRRNRLCSVRPFSGPNYRENEKRCGKHQPCAICGRAIENTVTAVYLDIIDGGSAFATPGTADESDPGYMGSYPIGPNCYHRHKHELPPLQDDRS